MSAAHAAPRLADRLVRDAQRGEWRDGETRYLLLRTDSLMGLFHRLAPASRADALVALAAAVAEAGGRSAARYRQTAPADPSALLETIAAAAADLGWGVWTFARASADELHLEVVNSPFAQGFGASSTPVCSAIAGMAGAVATMVLGRPASAEEIECAATGAQSCRFIARAEAA